ncbi:LADA_0D11518g1_1 [Lachancea dasiensis]|uniref:LADA_0D11518g1_1 n=1 Tax=Lachancea dasiensis TaxID=1072105 RepID=A0A1G4J836_9SACH|nr:LADA_0D11518g1_1 [Lachancea dasiensis]
MLTRIGRSYQVFFHQVYFFTRTVACRSASADVIVESDKKFGRPPRQQSNVSRGSHMGSYLLLQSTHGSHVTQNHGCIPVCESSRPIRHKFRSTCGRTNTPHHVPCISTQVRIKFGLLARMPFRYSSSPNRVATRYLAMRYRVVCPLCRRSERVPNGARVSCSLCLRRLSFSHFDPKGLDPGSNIQLTHLTHVVTHLTHLTHLLTHCTITSDVGHALPSWYDLAYRSISPPPPPLTLPQPIII